MDRGDLGLDRMGCGVRPAGAGGENDLLGSEANPFAGAARSLREIGRQHIRGTDEVGDETGARALIDVLRRADLDRALRVDDDVIMAHTAVTASLIPGARIVDVERQGRTLFLHTIGVRSDADAEHQRRVVLGWEARITRAVGSRAQLADLRRQIADADDHAHHAAETPRDGRTPI